MRAPCNYHRPAKVCLLLMGMLLMVANGVCVSSENVLDGDKTIYLLDNKGKAYDIGQVLFIVDESITRFEVEIDYQGFTDYFLSMKEMKCLEGPELWCHLKYPYPQPRTVSVTDLRWLSYDLLFMFKKPKEFGANFWNGIYYRFRVEGSTIVGEAQAVDLNHLASAPDDLSLPPFSEFDIEPIELSNRWLPKLVIE